MTGRGITAPHEGHKALVSVAETTPHTEHLSLSHALSPLLGGIADTIAYLSPFQTGTQCILLPSGDIALSFDEASNFGNVRSLVKSCRGGTVTRDNPRLLKQRLDDDGYPVVSIRRVGRKHSSVFRVHGLVLSAFVGPRPDGMECRHLDGNRQNNLLRNLRWGTRLENKKDSIRHGTAVVPPQIGECHSNLKLSEEKVKTIRRRRLDGEKLQPIADSFGVSVGLISMICNRRIWTHV